MAKEAARVAGELEDFVGSSLRDFVSVLSNDLKVRTPIDSGFARASWRPKSGGPGIENPEHPDFISTDREAAAKLQETIQRDFESVFRNNRKVEDKFLVNNADYINELNAGKSPQASAGFVERIINDHTD